MSGTRLNLTIPDQLAEFARHRAASGGFTSPGDYVRHLLREDHNREIEKLNALIQEGISSGPSNHSPKQIFSNAAKELKDIKKTTLRKKIKS